MSDTPIPTDLSQLHNRDIWLGEVDRVNDRGIPLCLRVGYLGHSNAACGIVLDRLMPAIRKAAERAFLVYRCGELWDAMNDYQRTTLMVRRLNVNHTSKWVERMKVRKWEALPRDIQAKLVTGIRHDLTTEKT